MSKGRFSTMPVIRKILQIGNPASATIFSSRVFFFSSSLKLSVMPRLSILFQKLFKLATYFMLVGNIYYFQI
jgi:hypothetical protein